MPLPGIPSWTDQAIELFHGTVDSEVRSILHGIDLTKSKPFKDFGRGFYTTTRRMQAEHWANQLAARRRRPAAVVRFIMERDDLAGMESLFFICADAAAVDYWSFIQFCRTIDADHRRQFKAGFYDAVAGPVAADWKEQRVIALADQISFHTDYAVQILDQCKKDQVI